jgi:transposase-like protein
MSQAAYSIRDQFCPNEKCRKYLKQGVRSITIHSANRFRCSVCGRTWVAHFNDESYRQRIDSQARARVQQLLFHGISIRQVARLVGVSTSTVQRLKKKSQEVQLEPVMESMTVAI